MLMALERLEGQRLGAPQKFEFAVQVFEDLHGLGAQRVAGLIALCEDHQKSPLELACQGLGEHRWVRFRERRWACVSKSSWCIKASQQNQQFETNLEPL